MQNVYFVTAAGQEIQLLSTIPPRVGDQIVGESIGLALYEAYPDLKKAGSLDSVIDHFNYPVLDVVWNIRYEYVTVHLGEPVRKRSIEKISFFQSLLRYFYPFVVLRLQRG